MSEDKRIEKNCNECLHFEACCKWTDFPKQIGFPTCRKFAPISGYRKQSEGEWETIPDYSNVLTTYRHICSVCGCFYKNTRSSGHKYCHNCGAKMKGGE